MPTLVSHISEIAFAELIPDGLAHMPEYDLDLDHQDAEQHVPELGTLEVALPGRW